MGIELKDLGLSQDALRALVVERAALQLLEQSAFDPEDETATTATPLTKALKKHIEQYINNKIAQMAEANVLPGIGQHIENMLLEETNNWGEKTAKPLTFIEFLVKRADMYLREEVNYEGKSRAELGSYTFSKAGTRLTYLVHKHLQYSIETAMKDAVNLVQAAIVPALADTAKMKLEEISRSLKIEVKTK